MRSESETEEEKKGERLIKTYTKVRNLMHESGNVIVPPLNVCICQEYGTLRDRARVVTYTFKKHPSSVQNVLFLQGIHITYVHKYLQLT